MFKRREKPSWKDQALQLLWPRGGWRRAFQYLRHRLTRLPGPPETIARGVFIGVFIAFTPLFGVHLFIAYGLARLVRAHPLAAVLSTFAANPLTIVPISLISMQIGTKLLGDRFVAAEHRSLAGKFGDAGWDLWTNFLALFTDRHTDWAGLIRFWDEVFLPYLIGGILAGVVAGTIAYYMSLPVIRAYQATRRKRIAAKRLKRARKAVKRSEPAAPSDK